MVKPVMSSSTPSSPKPSDHPPQSNPSNPSPPPYYRRSLLWAVGLGLVLLAVNMRAPLIGFGTVAPQVQQDLGVSTKLIGVIGTIPMLVFAMISPLAPRLAQRIGLLGSMLLASVALAGGILLRIVQPAFGWLAAGTLLLSVAIALGNVLIPAVVKQYFADRINTLMSGYSLWLAILAGLAAWLTPHLAQQHDWRFALGVWVVPTLIACVVWAWACQLGRAQADPSTDATADTHSMSAQVPRSVWRIPMAWYISLFMGLQSLLYFTLVNFLPSLLVDKGMDAAQVSNIGMVFQIIALPSVLFLSVVVKKGGSLRALMMSGAISNLLGVIGFGFMPNAWSYAAAVAAGYGCGITYTLCLIILTLRSKDSAQAAELSGMAQTIGYSIALIGPLATGWLKDLSDSWLLPMAVLTVLMAIKCVFAWLATQERPIE